MPRHRFRGPEGEKNRPARAGSGNDIRRRGVAEPHAAQGDARAIAAFHVEFHVFNAVSVHQIKKSCSGTRPQTLSCVNILRICSKKGEGRKGKGLGNRLTRRRILEC